MFNFFLLALSILFETSKNVFSASFSKKNLIYTTDVYKFNFFMYMGSFSALLFFGKGGGFSAFTLFTSLLFSIALWLNQFFFLKALNFGTMSFTTFIQGTSLVVPIIYGAIMWREKVSLLQILMLALLILCMFWALNIKKGETSGKWLIYSFLAMLFLGIIGILQTTHQMSGHKDELINFLRLAFLFTTIINLLGWRITEKKQAASFSMKSEAIPQSLLSGVFMGFVHIINLYLSGAMAKIIFFPIANGGLIFITLLSDLIFFKERLTLKQWFGMIIGTAALCILGL